MASTAAMSRQGRTNPDPAGGAQLRLCEPGPDRPGPPADAEMINERFAVLPHQPVQHVAAQRRHLGVGRADAQVSGVILKPVRSHQPEYHQGLAVARQVAVRARPCWCSAWWTASLAADGRLHQDRGRDFTPTELRVVQMLLGISYNEAGSGNRCWTSKFRVRQL